MFGKIGVTDDEARKYYEAHLERVHDAADGHAARDPRRRAERREGVNVAADDAAKAKAEQIRARAAGRRQLREAGRRGLGRAVEGQRRPDRAAQHRRSVARSAQADRVDEGRATSPSRSARTRGYQIFKLESSTPTQTHAVRTGARADQRAACSPTSARTSSRSTSQKLRAQAIIEWKNEDVKKAYEEGLQAAGGCARRRSD